MLAAAVVVDDDDARDALQERRRRDKVRDVRVDDDEHGIECRRAREIIRMHDDVPVFLVVLEDVLELADALVHVRQHNLDGLAELAGHLGHAHRGAEAVEVLVVVAHDVDGIGPLHDLADGVRDDARLDACVLLHSLGAAAEELRLAADLHGDLVAAAAEREVKPRLGLRAEVGHALAVRHRHAHRKRDGQAVRAVELPDLVEDVEASRDGLVEPLALEDDDVEVI